MKQQVNFLPLMPEPQKRYINASIIIILLGTILTISAIYSLTAYVRIKIQASELAKQDSALKPLIQKTQQLKKQYPALCTAKSIPKWINYLEKTYQNKHQTWDHITSMQQHYRTCFNHYLLTISHTITPGVWLNRITVKHQPKQAATLTLEGNTNEQSLLKQFISRLNKKPLFNQQEIILKGKDVSNHYHFTLTFSPNTIISTPKDAGVQKK